MPNCSRQHQLITVVCPHRIRLTLPHLQVPAMRLLQEKMQRVVPMRTMPASRHVG